MWWSEFRDNSGRKTSLFGFPVQSSEILNDAERRAEPLEMQGDAADDALGWPNHQELVVERLIAGCVPEEIADREQHFPPGVAEIHERQRLPDLQVETAVESRPRRLSAEARLREPVAEPIEHHH